MLGLLSKRPSPLTKEIQLRVTRGVELMDAVQPGWWKRITPSTLDIKDRGACVFAQATPSFLVGITQVADRATAQGIKVQKLYGAHRKRVHGWADNEWFLEHQGTKPIIDVFYYGFDVDQPLRDMAPNQSRRAAWKALSKAWIALVQQRQKKGA